jgi:DNA-binding transcriptional LysR family regulator
MLTVDELRFFATVASAASLAAAARKLNVSAPAVTQRLRHIEERLGVRLAHRTGRQLMLTDEGELVVERSRAILAEISALGDAIAARRRRVIGHLRVLAPPGFGRRHIAPAVAAFREANPDVTVDLILKDMLGRHPSEAWDVAVHIGRLPDSSLIVQRIAPNRRLLCASPSYVARAPLVDPAELGDHACLVLRENEEDVTLWRFTAPDQSIVSVRVQPVLATNDGDVLRGWALSGQGVMVRSEWDVAEDLRMGRLIELLPAYKLPDADVVALFAARIHRSARSQQFLEHIRGWLDPPPWRRLAGA